MASNKTFLQAAAGANFIQIAQKLWGDVGANHRPAGSLTWTAHQKLNWLDANRTREVRAATKGRLLSQLAAEQAARARKTAQTAPSSSKAPPKAPAAQQAASFQTARSVDASRRSSQAIVKSADASPRSQKSVVIINKDGIDKIDRRRRIARERAANERAELRQLRKMKEEIEKQNRLPGKVDLGSAPMNQLRDILEAQNAASKPQQRNEPEKVPGIPEGAPASAPPAKKREPKKPKVPKHQASVPLPPQKGPDPPLWADPANAAWHQGQVEAFARAVNAQSNHGGKNILSPTNGEIAVSAHNCEQPAYWP